MKKKISRSVRNELLGILRMRYQLGSRAEKTGILRTKYPVGSKKRKVYFKPATPGERLIDHPKVSVALKKEIESDRGRLDPSELLHQIREGQGALAALTHPERDSKGPIRMSLENVLSQ